MLESELGYVADNRDIILAQVVDAAVTAVGQDTVLEMVLEQELEAVGLDSSLVEGTDLLPSPEAAAADLKTCQVLERVVELMLELLAG